ncbi:MAG: hypothetical protein V4667_13760 [Bacteroidota bacterium]
MENTISTGTKVLHENYGRGKVVKADDIAFTIDFGEKGIIEISRRSIDKLKVLEAPIEMEKSDDENLHEFEKMLIRVLNKYSDISQVVEMGDKWAGGKMILQPGSDSLKAKEIPIETFFHKIVMVRDRLRVLEQNINANAKLNDEDKVNMQQYITRIYGSLTTFNILFKNPTDNFVGEKSKD